MGRSPSIEYLLGANSAELERLRFQHDVWKPVTDRFFDRLGVGEGWHCLDVGAGPGFVTMDFRERVGDSGRVIALEPSEFFHRWLTNEVGKRKWTNVECVRGTAEDASIPVGSVDLIYVRWVMSFVLDPQKFFARLISGLKPGGIVAVQDYYYEGLSLFPRGGAFDRMANVVREYYRRGGGDPYITGKLPAVFRTLGLELVDFFPNCLAGGPESGIMEWAHRFFTAHMAPMVEKGILTRDEGEAILADWHVHRANQDALFFSPIVVDVAARLDRA